jgi:HSP20 family protein
MFTDLMLRSPFDELWALASPFTRNSWRGARAIDTTSGMFPSSDVVSTDDGWRIRVALPGIAPEHVEVSVADRTLHVRAIEQDQDRAFTRYEQRISVPDTVDAEHISATLEHGLLDITLPLKATVKPRRIAIATTGNEPKKLTA